LLRSSFIAKVLEEGETEGAWEELDGSRNEGEDTRWEELSTFTGNKYEDISSESESDEDEMWGELGSTSATAAIPPPVLSRRDPFKYASFLKEEDTEKGNRLSRLLKRFSDRHVGEKTAEEKRSSTFFRRGSAKSLRDEKIKEEDPSEADGSEDDSPSKGHRRRRSSSISSFALPAAPTNTFQPLDASARRKRPYFEMQPGYRTRTTSGDDYFDHSRVSTVIQRPGLFRRKKTIVKGGSVASEIFADGEDMSDVASRMSRDDGSFIQSRMSRDDLESVSPSVMSRAFSVVSAESTVSRITVPHVADAQGFFQKIQDDLANGGNGLKLVREAEEAVRELQRIARHAPQAQEAVKEVGDGLNELGLMYFLVGKEKEAVERLEEALFIRRQEFGADVLVGETLFNLGTVHKSSKRFRKAANYFNLARHLYMSIGDVDKCIDCKAEEESCLDQKDGLMHRLKTRAYGVYY